MSGLSDPKQGRVLFQSVQPANEQSKDRGSFKRDKIGNDERIEMLQRIASVEARVDDRSKSWALKRLMQLEKVYLQKKIGFNKIVKVVGEKLKQIQIRFMEGMIQASEGEIDFEELLKSSQRNSLTSESRFSTIWRNRGSVGPNRGSIGPNRESVQSSAGTNLKGVDSFLQHLLDGASKQQKEASGSLLSKEDHTRFSSSRGAPESNKNKKDVNFKYSKQVVTSNDDMLTRIEKNQFNRRLDKVEELMSSKSERNVKRVEQLIPLEKAFAQFSRVMTAARHRLMLIAFNRILMASQSMFNMAYINENIGQLVDVVEIVSTRHELRKSLHRLARHSHVDKIRDLTYNMDHVLMSLVERRRLNVLEEIARAVIEKRIIERICYRAQRNSFSQAIGTLNQSLTSIANQLGERSIVRRLLILSHLVEQAMG